MNNANPTNQITLRELLDKGRDIIRYFRQKRLVLVLAVLLGGVGGVVYALFKTDQYKANLSFVLADPGSSTGLSAYAGIASQFGIDLGGGGQSSSLFQGDNILAFIQSQRMITQTLLSEANIGGKPIVLANRYAAVIGFRSDWDDEPMLKNFIFQADSLPSGNPVQDSLILILYRHVLKETISVAKPDKKLNIIQITTKSPDEQFAQVFTELLIHNVMDFYVQTKTQKEQENLDILTRQADSVRKALYTAIGNVAVATDANPNPNRALQQLNVSAQRRRVEVQANSAILEELVKNQELAKISLRKQMPILQIIDRPVLPLESNAIGPFKAGILGALLFGFLTASFLMLRVLFGSIHATQMHG